MDAANFFGFDFLAQVNLSEALSQLGGHRVVVGVTMIIHMFFAEMFVGFAIAAPVMQAWGARTGSPRMDRLAHSMVRFNVLTFSTGATFAVLFLVLLVGLYPQVTTSLFTHFFYILVIAMVSMGLTLYMMYTYYYKWDRYAVLHKGRHILIGFAMGLFIWIWMTLMSAIDTYMVSGGGPDTPRLNGNNVANFWFAVRGIFNPLFTEEVLHRTFANLSWPAFALAAWGALMYIRAKSPEDKSFYDWTSSVGLTWGVAFLMLQPIVGFFFLYAIKVSVPKHPINNAAAGGAYERLTHGYTSNLLYINLLMVVALFVLSAIALYFGASRNPDRSSRVPIRFFGLVAAVAGIYSVSPLAEVPVFWVRYVALLIMVVAMFGAFVTYLRARPRFRYGSPSGSYRAVLMALGVIAAVVALNMGFMKSNSRVPYTVYNQPGYTVGGYSSPPTGF